MASPVDSITIWQNKSNSIIGTLQFIFSCNICSSFGIMITFKK